MREILQRVFATGVRLTVTMLAVAVPAAALADPAPKLPQNHEYQKTLYGFMKTLTAQDMTHGVPGVMEVKPSPQDPDYLYRNYIDSLLHMPMVGSKRASCGVNSAPECFTIPLTEKPDGVGRWRRSRIRCSPTSACRRQQRRRSAESV